MYVWPMKAWSSLWEAPHSCFTCNSFQTNVNFTYINQFSFLQWQKQSFHCSSLHWFPFSCYNGNEPFFKELCKCFQFHRHQVSHTDCTLAGPGSLHKALFDPLSSLPLRAGWTLAICRARGCVEERGRSHVWEMLLRGHSSETAQSDMTPYCQRGKALLVRSHPNQCELVWCLRMLTQVALWLYLT